MNTTLFLPDRQIKAMLLLLLLLTTACDREPPHFYPFTPGLIWQYQLRITTMDGTTTQKYVVSNQAPLDWDGRRIHARRTLDGTWLFYLETGQGIYRIASQRPGEVDPT